jgi:hypothetical protein
MLKVMKRFIVGGIILVALCITLLPQPTHAVGMPFGGKVLSMFVPGVVCVGGEGPVFIKPSGLVPPGPYAPTPMTLRKGKRFISIGYNILGKYLPFPTPGICWTTTPIPLPVPVFPIVMFGT